MVLKNLEFEIKWRLRELIQELSAGVVVNTGIGQKLLKDLEAIEAMKAAKRSA